MNLVHLLVFVSVIQFSVCTEPITWSHGSINLIIEKNWNFQFLSVNGETKLEGKFLVPEDIEVEDCSKNDELCLRVGKEDVVKIKPADTHCAIVSVISNAPTCFNYSNHQWFGGSERKLQLWPIQDLVIKEEAYYSKDAEHQAVLEAYWLSSTGVFIYVGQDIPLFVDSNNLEENSLCLYTNGTPPYRPAQETNLLYEICAYDDVKVAHQYAIDNLLGHATKTVDQRMTHEPIWSTWARYKRPINESVVLDFANQILAYNFNNSQLEIDDLWEPCYGHLTFDREKFPDPSRLTSTLKEKGFRVTLWVHPFVNTDCEPVFSEALADGKLVLNDEGSPVTPWWNGQAGHVDFTNTTTREWYLDKLRSLVQNDGIDSFKVDAGESSWLPQLPVLNSSLQTPDEFVALYVDTALEFGNFIEVRVGRGTQDRSVFIRMIDKDSRWGYDNGLQSLVTTLLQMNVAGYSYVLPDMIGGNEYGDDILTKELFIRWLQANVFMPSLQFSAVPWDFDDETVGIAHSVLDLRARFNDYIDFVIANHTITGSPVNPPVWWLSPTNEDALKCNDEYLLGDKLLVAPVMVDGARSRDIFLPDGSWQDVAIENSEVIVGPTWLRDYPVELADVPVFQEVS